MTAQSVLAKGIYPEFNFRNPSAGADSEVGSANISGRVPMFVDSTSPAVIRLTHGTSNKSTQGVTSVSRSHLFDIAASGLETTLNPKTAPFVDGQSKQKSAKRSHSRADISPQNNVTEVEIQDIQTLLTSENNLRPSSRLSVSSGVNTANGGENTFTDAHRCSTTLTNKSHVSSDVEEENESDNAKENLNQNTYTPLKTNLQKKGKKKKRNKQILSAKSKAKRQSSNKLIQYGKMKIPVSTHIKSDKQPVIKPNQISNLSDILQAQCKRITLIKYDNTSRESSRSLDPRTTRQTVNPEIYQSRIQTAKPYKSVHGNRASDVTQTYDLCLPQVASALVVKSSPAIPKSTVYSSEQSNSQNSFLMPNYNPRTVYGGGTSQEPTKIVKVFLSEKHSGTLKDCGMEFPCAPPVTPTPDQLKKVEYVPSMNDIRAQRAVKIKLQVLEREALKKLERQKEEKAKLEKLLQKDREKELKIKQRNEIYALNKIMTELENGRFKEFCAKKGINIGS